MSGWLLVEGQLSHHGRRGCAQFLESISHVEDLKERQCRGLVPANLCFAGPADNPVDAMVQADVVVNLSRFQESFGRAILEAMAAQRPVVCYAWGALP